MIKETSIKNYLASQYARGKKRFSYIDIGKLTGKHYAPGDLRDGCDRVAINDVLEGMNSDGYLRLRPQGKKEGAVVYNGSFLPSMETLCRAYGYRTVMTEEESLRRILSEMKLGDGAVKDLVAKTVYDIDNGNGYNVRLFGHDFSAVNDILTGADAVIKNTGETYIRDISKKTYNDSKRMSELRQRIETFVKHCSPDDILAEYEKLCGSGETKSIFPLYGIRQRPYPIMFEADAELDMKKGTVSTHGYPYPIISNIVPDICSVTLLDEGLLTIENQTTYDDFYQDNTGKLFSGGFPGLAVKMFLSKIYTDNPGKRYMHWGDIDVGGFRIFYDIRKVLPSLEPFRMDPDTLLHYKEMSLTTPLTYRDREELMKMKHDKFFSESITVMLDEDIKFEQEAFFSN